MKKFDIISISCFVVLMLLNYLVCFLGYAGIDTFDGFITVLLLISYPAVLYIAVWYFIFLVKKNNSNIAKLLISLLLVATPLVFVMPAINPIFQGLKLHNNKLGGNDVLTSWADKIFQMSLSEVTEDYNNQNAVFDIRELLTQEVFPDIIGPATILEEGGKKVIKVRYLGNGGVLFGDADLIKSISTL